MCTEIYARFFACPHSHLLKWTYCSLIASNTPAAARACQKYRRKVRGCVSGRARECAECTMDRKIAEDFGDAVLASVRQCVGQKPDTKRRRFWQRVDRKGGEEVPFFSPMPVDIEVWSAVQIAPAILPNEREVISQWKRTHKRARSRHDSASLHSREHPRSDITPEEQRRGTWTWLRSSFGRRG
ncbi:uncharacterized protein M421DRAFT_303380 [Didymella exigua CBS 183.55]|uniref:Uncharacterized protein n=1 Tax=Didymella exigua CBS 183.55 TaxID=1150837 RepID=A0A6A5R9D3_9PLEO|nr:uncharacterized protein M421DRAFT_303380 [Didymella exigua CBS 183.55]KAF1923860.1 hypothetical protein M421DRAFT_303380 [Didymella exigua CBS 183.55]